MVPSGTATRQVVIWSVPTLVILLSLVWYKRKRNTLRTDPGGTSDSATKAKADKETNGHIPSKTRLAPKEEQPVEKKEPAVEEKALPAVEEQVRVEKIIAQEAAPKERVEEPCRENIVQEAAPKERVEEPCREKKSSGEESAPVKVEEVVEKAEEVVEKAEEVVEKAEEVGEKVGEVVEKVGEVVEKVEEVVEKVEEVVEKVGEVCEKVEEVVEKVEEVVEEVEEGVEVAEEVVDAAKVVEKCESLPSEESKSAMSEEDASCEGGAAALPQEEKVVSLGGKLASLTLEEQRADADRDSANHSPVDAMLASPSLSNYSDEHSEGSSDSGKGCSDVASPPSRTPLGGSSLAGDGDADTAGDADADNDADVRYTIYEFLLPHYLVGRLIGPRGSFVQEIKSKTNATVQVKKHPDTSKQKICVVDGMQSEVDAALAMIRDRYPVRKFPQVTLEQVSILSNVQPICSLIPEYCQLHLVEGVNNEVMVSCMVSPGHMFLQQPYHPTFQYLNRLSVAMNSVYSQADAPHVPEPITVGSICVAPATEGWYRVQVVSLDDEAHSCEVKFVDHGGYMTLSNSSLRQIHHDFMSVPFQATECFLASIKPAGGSNVWSDEALRLVDELTRGQMLYAQVYDYTEYSIPLVYLYCCINSLVVLINQELVARGLAELDDVSATESTEAAALVAAAAGVAQQVAPVSRQQDLTEGPSEVEAV